MNKIAENIEKIRETIERLESSQKKVQLIAKNVILNLFVMLLISRNVGVFLLQLKKLI